MSRLAVTVAAFVSIGTLVGAAWSHAKNFGEFVRAIAKHRIWPRPVVPLVAAGVLIIEGALGLIGLTGLSGVPLLPLGGALVATSGILAAFGGYGAVLALFRPGVPCGCSAADQPVDAWIPGRALLLSIGALFAAVKTDQVLLVSDLGPDLLIAALASMALGIVIWTFPLAVAHPFPSSVDAQVRHLSEEAA